MFDTRAVRQALRCLGSEPAPVPVDDVRRVTLAGGGNEVAMSLYRAMGRGTSELSEPQIRERQQRQLEQFEQEAAEVLRLIGAFRTVVSLEDERAVRRGLPQPEAVTVVATGTGTLHHAATDMVPVRAGAMYTITDAAPDDGLLRPEEGAAGRWEGTAVSSAAVGRLAPDMETCDDCRGTVAIDPNDGSITHENGMPAFSKDGHIIHAERLQRIVDQERLQEVEREVDDRGLDWPDMSDPGEPAPKVQQGPAMGTEEEAQAIVKRALEAATRDIQAIRAADHGRDSGIEPGSIDTSEFDFSLPFPDVKKPLLVRCRDGLARLRAYLDGYTVRQMDDLEEAQRRRA